MRIYIYLYNMYIYVHCVYTLYIHSSKFLFSTMVESSFIPIHLHHPVSFQAALPSSSGVQKDPLVPYFQDHLDLRNRCVNKPAAFGRKLEAQVLEKIGVTWWIWKHLLWFTTKRSLVIYIYMFNVHTYYIALHYITSHYIALHAYIYIQKYQHTYKVSLQYDMAYLISYNMNIIFIS